MINNAKVVFMFSISVCYSDSALGLKISLDCMGECMVVDIYEDAFKDARRLEIAKLLIESWNHWVDK